MKIIRNILIFITFLALVLFAISKIFQEQIGERLFARALEQNMGTNLIADLPDGLHIGICGAGSPLPDPNRAGPCTFAIAGDQLFVFDAGDGAAKNILRMGAPIGDLEAVFLTHYHSDHIDGLGNMALFRWTSVGNDQPLPVYGALGAKGGVDEIVDGFNAAYRHDVGYRVAHHGADIMPPTGAGLIARNFDMGAETSRVVYAEGDVKITAFEVAHAPIEPAVGYRIEYKGRSAVISGDTSRSETLIAEARDVDLLVHESLNKEMVKKMEDQARANGNDHRAKIFYDIQDYHTDPVEIMEIASEAGVSEVVLTHIVPALPISYLNGYYLKDTHGLYDGKTHIANDRELYSMPADSTKIKKSKIGF